MAISRRSFVAGASAAAAVLPLAHARVLAAAGPAAVPAQGYPARAMDELAIALFRSSAVQAAIPQGEALLRNSPKGAFANEARLIPEAVAPLFFIAAQTVANDPFAPRLHWYLARHHKAAGLDVPDARGTVENPDNYYRICQINPALRYRITGRRAAVPPAAETFSLLSELVAEAAAGARSVGFISDRQIKADENGRFVITIGPEPAEGRTNHIQMQRDARMLLVRDTMSNWETQLPNALTVECLNTTDVPPLPFDALAQRVAGMGMRGVQTWGLDFPRYDYDAISVNTMGPLIVSSKRSGGLVSQMSSHGMFEIADDEALVVTIPALDAEYTGFELADIWMRSAEYVTRTGSLNGSQVVPNADGSITYVIAARDPGVHNWADPGPIRRGSITARTQNFSPTITGDLLITTRLTKLADLRQVLPKGTAMVGPDERRKQLSARAAAYRRRLSALAYAEAVDLKPAQWPMFGAADDFG